MSEPSAGATEAAATTTEAKDAKKPDPVDVLVSTEHTFAGHTESFDYTATTGRMVVREEVYEDGVFKGYEAKAEVGITSYVRHDTDVVRRPVTFAFNGGPGSASVWLHLGLLGPVRVVMGDAGDLAPPPYGVTDNPESLLEVSDLVFIDPVMTGQSRVLEGDKVETYSGFTRDYEMVAEIIRLWTTRNGRWGSPKFLCGESYGTLRAVAVADHLQTSTAMYLNGIMLISSVLDFETVDFEEHRNDRAYALYLPTYAAIAHYHGKLPGRTLEQAIAAAEEYAARDYLWVLAQGERLAPEERTAAAAMIAELTGLTTEYVERSNLRLEHFHFFTELLRDEGTIVGRRDGRFTGPSSDRRAGRVVEDPSHAAISGPYGAAYHHYVHHALESRIELRHEQINMRVWPWSYKEFEGRPVDVSERLERAMRMNPHLKVHIAYGYYDGATPHFAAESVVARLSLAPELRENIEHRYYEAGHMMYVHEPSRLQQSEDLRDFVLRAVP